MPEAWSWPRSSERRTLRRRVAAWPQIPTSTVFSAELNNEGKIRAHIKDKFPLEMSPLRSIRKHDSHAGYPRQPYGCDLLRGAASLQTRGVLWHHPEVTRAGHPRSGQMGHALFIAESFGGWDGDGVAGGQQAGQECAEREERGGC